MLQLDEMNRKLTEEKKESLRPDDIEGEKEALEPVEIHKKSKLSRLK